jgi:hypothetical protein
MTRRRWAFLVVLLAAHGFIPGPTQAAFEQYRVNGGTTLAVFDANRNNVVPDDGDCIVEGTGVGNTFALMGTQHVVGNAIPLKVCEPCYENNALVNGGSSVFEGTGFVSSNFAEVEVNETCVPNCCGSLPTIAEFFSSLPSPSPSPTYAPPLTTGGGAGRFQPPLLRAAVIKEIDDFDPEVTGSGFLCNSGVGTDARVTTKNGVPLLVSLKRINSVGGEFVCAPIPAQRADNSQNEIVDLCIPSNKGRSLLTLDGLEVAVIDLNLLEPCIRSNVPTSTESGLVMLALGLLGTGAWVISRRRSFANAMP